MKNQNLPNAQEPKGHKGSCFREAELKGISTACTATTNNSPYVPDAPRTSTEVTSPTN